MGAHDEVRIPFQFRVREIRRLAPGETPPEPPHAGAIGPNHHHLPMRIELHPSPELDALLASLDAPETPPPPTPTATRGPFGGPDGLGYGIVGRRRRAMRAAANPNPPGMTSDAVFRPGQPRWTPPPPGTGTKARQALQATRVALPIPKTPLAAAVTATAVLATILTLMANHRDRSQGVSTLVDTYGLPASLARLLWDGCAAILGEHPHTAAPGKTGAPPKGEPTQSEQSRSRLRDNVLSMLRRSDRSLARGLNRDPGRSRLEIHHTVPKREDGFNNARKVLKDWSVNIDDPANAAILPKDYHRGKDVHGRRSDRSYDNMVNAGMLAAQEEAKKDEIEYGDQVARADILDALRHLSDEVVARSHDPRAILFERMLHEVDERLRPGTFRRNLIPDGPS